MVNPLLSLQAAAPTSSPASAGKPADAPETPFNQVLSREMADKPQSSSQQDGNTQAPASAAKAAEPSAAANATKKNPGKKADDADSDKTSASTDSGAAAPQDPALAGAMANPADMMALIAGAAKVTAPQTAAKNPALPDGGDIKSVKLTKDVLLGVQTAKTAPASDGKLAAAPDAPKPLVKADVAPTELTAKSDNAAETGTDFSGQLKLAVDAKDGNAPPADKSVENDVVKGAIEKLTATGAAKPPETAAPAQTQPVAVAAMPQTTAIQAAAQFPSVNGADHLAPRVGTPGWDNALSQKVVWMVGGEHQSASLTLNPPDLGPLQVVLNVSNSMATATFVTAQPEVKQAIENALPKLREMMGEAGIQLGQATVNTGMPNQRESQRDNNRSAFGSGSRTSAVGGVDAALPVARTVISSAGEGLVDTFV